MKESRLTEDEVSDSVYKCKPETDVDSAVAIKNHTIEEGVAFTINGKHDKFVSGKPVVNDVNSKFAYAKTVVSSALNKTKFFILSNGYQFVDPMGLYAEKDLNKRIGDHSVWKWKETNVDVFNLYVKFLSTKNKAYYYRALRETF